MIDRGEETKFTTFRVEGLSQRAHNEELPPALNQFLLGLSHSLPFVIIQSNDSLSIPPQNEVKGIKRRSATGGRSVELDLPPRLTIWEDSYGTFFSSLDAKGVILTHPRILREDTKRQEWGVYGLLDTGEVSHQPNTSRVLRSLGVETERIELISLPSQFPVRVKREDGQEEVKVMGKEEFKHFLFERVKSDQPVSVGVLDKAFFTFTKDEVPLLEVYAGEFTPSMIIRSSQVAETIKDILMPQTEQEFRTQMATIFTFVNARNAAVARREGKPVPRKFNAEKDEDIRRYIFEYLPRRLAINLGRMHNAGVRHGCLHDQNISAVGSPRDLATLTGVIIGRGTKPHAIGELWRRASMLGPLATARDYGDLTELVGTMERSLIIPITDPKWGEYRTIDGLWTHVPWTKTRPWITKIFQPSIKGEKNRQTFWTNFYTTYFSEFHFEKYLLDTHGRKKKENAVPYQSREQYLDTELYFNHFVGETEEDHLFYAACSISYDITDVLGITVPNGYNYGDVFKNWARSQLVNRMEERKRLGLTPVPLKPGEIQTPQKPVVTKKNPKR